MTDPAAWPETQEPCEQLVSHDALYRVVGVDYSYRKASGAWSAESGPATDWRGEQARSRTAGADPMQRKPAPMVPELPERRPINLTYEYDWLANMVEWTDDAHAFHERSLGAGILNGHEAGKRPGALYLASDLGPESSTGIRGGWLNVAYGDSGNVTEVTVRGQCRDRGGATCSDPGGTDDQARADALAGACRCDVEQHYQYRWDELNRLSEARRYDRDGTGIWELQVRQRYRYDGANVRMVKETRDGFMNGPPSARLGEGRATLYVYPGDFERRGLRQEALGYEADEALGTETQYLVAGTRLVWKTGAMGPGGTGFEKDARLTMALPNLIQSTSAVVDLFSGDLLERGTFLPNGARETLRANSEVEAFQLEPVGFTGKEGDSEVGLVYFGERYLMPHLGRWASADPLQVHNGGGGEFGNSYHYVAAQVLQARDPRGTRIVLTGDAAKMKQTFVALQALTQQRLHLDPDTGIVSIMKGRVDNDAGRKGTMLVNRRIMDEHHTTRVHQVRGDSGSQTVPDMTDRTRANLSDQTGVTASDVYLNHGADLANQDQVNGGEGRPIAKDPVERFTLGHELGHADRHARGVLEFDSLTRHDYMPESGGEVTEQDKVEEFIVTGLPYRRMNSRGEWVGTSVEDNEFGPDGIENVSENDLRREQGQPERSAYESPQNLQRRTQGPPQVRQTFRAPDGSRE